MRFWGFVVLFFLTETQANICDESQVSLELSQEPGVGRLIVETNRGRFGCTVSLIGKDCAVTAGHCLSGEFLSHQVQFKVPPSVDGQLQTPDKEHIFQIDLSSVEKSVGRWGNDWAVFKIKIHPDTGELAGEKYGYFGVQSKSPYNSQLIRIYGFGSRPKYPNLHWSQKTHTGPVVSHHSNNRTGRGISYFLSTKKGDSGAPLIDELTGELIGVHNRPGSCMTGRGGTSVVLNESFQQAMSRCLKR